MLDVVNVIFRAFFDGVLAAQAVDLGPAGDAGFDPMPFEVVGHPAAELFDEMRTFGARAYEAHVPPEDVPELREFVPARPPSIYSCSFVFIRG